MSREKLCKELGFEPFRLQRWYRKLCLFYKAFENDHPQYLFHLIPVSYLSHTSRNVHSIPILSVKHRFSKNSFFPSNIFEWNKLDPAIRSSEGLPIF